MSKDSIELSAAVVEQLVGLLTCVNQSYEGSELSRCVNDSYLLRMELEGKFKAKTGKYPSRN